MDMLNRLALLSEWESYYKYKIEKGSLSGKEAEDLRSFIDKEEYLPVVKRLLRGEELTPPEKTLINKHKAGKKRIVYTFPREENYVLKLLTFLLREYDDVFSPNLYSFRKERGVKLATRNILRIRNLPKCYVYKVDISDYFNSVDVELLIPKISMILQDDKGLLDFFCRVLRSPYVRFQGEIIEEKKGIMAGVPISTFFANVYLRELDFYFCERNIPYMRYSDDIIVFGESEERVLEYSKYIKGFLREHGLKVNPDKEIFTKPSEEWTFLGFSYHDGVIDISKVSKDKLKAKIRRKARALERWARRKGLSSELAARALVKRFNAKLYENPIHNELTWSRWFFPVINTDKSLREIDRYMEDTIRFLATGKRTKSRFNLRYEDMKALGFRSLVNEYHKHKKET